MNENEFTRWKLHDLIVKQYREVGGGEYGKDPSDDHALLVDTLGQVARHVLPEAQTKLAEYDLSPEDVGLGAIVRRVRADREALLAAKAEIDRLRVVNHRYSNEVGELHEKLAAANEAHAFEQSVRAQFEEKLEEAQKQNQSWRLAAKKRIRRKSGR